MIGLTFLDFLDPDEMHQSSAISDFFTDYVNVYPSRILSMPKGIIYLLKLRVNNLRQPNPPFSEADGDMHSVTFFTV
jgi:hypothetical protein